MTPTLDSIISPADQLIIDAAMACKMLYVEGTERGDMAPLIIAQRKGVVLVTVVAPKVDKYQALDGALILRKSLDADRLLIALDSHFATSLPGETPEQMAERLPQGSMQKMCDEEGACATGVISDCLLCISVGADGAFTQTVIPYDYHGKGTTFAWKIILTPQTFSGDGPYGLIPDNLRHIMADKSVTDDLFTVGASMGLSRPEMLYHGGRGGFMLLESRGYRVFNTMPPRTDLAWAS